jgi:3-hydroxymyristoyl/3-hydroxydecanoyl-(acyl carrier protein) dehydratase
MGKVVQSLDQSKTMCYTTPSVDHQSVLRHADDMITARAQVPAASIWFDGHFPEAAVLPGVAQLAIVVEVLNSVLDKPVRVTEVSRVRFKQAVRPEESIEVQISPKQNDHSVYDFRLLKGNEVACSGCLKVVAK